MALIADTRFLIAYFFPPSEEARRRLGIFMSRTIEEGLLIPALAVTEFVKVAGGRVGFEGAKARLASLLAHGVTVEPFTYEDSLGAGKLLLRAVLPIGDACIASVAIRRKAKVVSDDRDFGKASVKTTWPL